MMTNMDGITEIEEKAKVENNTPKDCEMDIKIEIKEEPWWLKTSIEASCDSIFLQKSKAKDLIERDLPPAELPRLTTEAVSSDNLSSFFSEDSDRKSGDNCEVITSEGLETCLVEKNVNSFKSKQHSHREQSRKIYNAALFPKALNYYQDHRRINCDIAKNYFSKVSTLKRHNLTLEDKKAHKCDVCEKVFGSKSHLKAHKLIHEGIKAYKCDICENSFMHKSHLNAHYLTHLGRKPYQCDICEKIFTKMSNLKRHINATHEGKKPYKCEICGNNFREMSHLKAHNLIHEGKKPHKCDYCGKSFTQLVHLREHRLIHQGIKTCKCDVCEKSFTKLSNLKRHISLIHGRKKAI